MNRRPLTAIAGCWIAGSGLAGGYSGGRFWLLWLGISLLCPASGLITRLPWRKLAVLWLAFTLGAAYWLYNEASNVSRIDEALSGSEAELAESLNSADELAAHMEGTIVSAVEIDGDRADFTLKVSRISPSAAAGAGQGLTSEAGRATAVAGASVERPQGAEIPGGEKVAVQLRLAAQDELKTAATWERGQQISLDGSFERPQQARNFGGFDYRRYLHNQRIHWLVKASGASALHVQSRKWGTAAFFGKVDSLRSYLAEHLERIFPGWQAGYMKGLLIGFQDELDPDKYAQFTQLGLTHILAISGGHVAINVGLIFWLLRICRVNRETALTLVLFFVPVYVLLTGFSPSIIRSGMMTMLGVYLLRRGLFKDSFNVLSAAALLMLLWDPYYLLNVSFQLSFAVTAGLILFVPLLTPYFRWLPPKVRGTVAITLAAQIVSFPLTIFYFNQFSLLSVGANLLIVPVISAAALPLGTAALLLSLFSVTLGTWVAVPVRLVNTATFWAAEWLSGRSGFMTYWKSPSLLWIAVFYAACYLLLYWGKRREGLGMPGQDGGWPADETVPLAPLEGTAAGREPHRRHRSVKRAVSAWWVSCLRLRQSPSPSQWSYDVVEWTNEFGWGSPAPNIRTIAAAMRSWAGAWRKDLLRAAVAAGLALMIAAGYQPAYANGVGYIEFIDVGQGDCALITTPSGAHLLVDGGGTVSFRKASDAWRERREPFEVGAKTVVPLLKKRGIHRLDAVILTHGDQDHLGGLQAVLEQFPVEALLINGSLAESKTMAKFMETALSRRIPVYSAARGMTLKPDNETKLDFLYPLPAEEKEETIPYVEKQNHRSLVFLLRMSGAAFLFTGDMDEAAEREVLELEQKRDETAATEAGQAQDNLTLSPVHLMKIAHHGSKTSTSAAWLSYWRPVAALISVGASNSYGHPHPTVVERLESQRIRLFRTDQQGEVQLQVRDGQIKGRHKLP